MNNSVRFLLPRSSFTLDVDLALPAHGITALFGASGSGKTSVLRCVAGLERAAQAKVNVAGACWQDSAAGVWLPTHRRALGYVFQEASLFPHLDVRANLRYGLQRRGASQDALNEAIALLGIAELLPRRPDTLSGGERQRVAIARALASQPQLLLLDEPLAALDAPRRQEVLPWLERLRDSLRIPMLYVTHAVDELTRLADHVVLLERGQVLAQGPVEAVMADVAATRLLQDEACSVLRGVVHSRDAQWQLTRIACASACLWLPERSGTPLPEGLPVRLRVLARDVSIATTPPAGSSIQNVLPCTVLSISPDAHPAQVLVRLQCEGAILLSRITARAAHTLGLSPGQAVWAQVKSLALAV